MHTGVTELHYLHNQLLLKIWETISVDSIQVIELPYLNAYITYSTNLWVSFMAQNIIILKLWTYSGPPLERPSLPPGKSGLSKRWPVKMGTFKYIFDYAAERSGLS